jgi:hypothetical protein
MMDHTLNGATTNVRNRPDVGRKGEIMGNLNGLGAIAINNDARELGEVNGVIIAAIPAAVKVRKDRNQIRRLRRALKREFCVLLSRRHNRKLHYYVVDAKDAINVKEWAKKYGVDDPKERYLRRLREDLIKKIEHDNDDAALNAMLALRELGNQNGNRDTTQAETIE